MKRNLLKVLPLLLLGGVLGLAAAPAAFEAAGVKAEDVVETKEVKFTSSKIKAALSSSYSNTSFTIDNLSFNSKQIMYSGSYGSECVQIDSGQDGFWSTSTFEDYYISSLTVAPKTNALRVYFGKSTNPSTSYTEITSEKTFTFTQNDGYTYFAIRSTSKYAVMKSLSITFTKNSDQPLPPFEGDYKLVEDASDLSSGDKIVLGNVAKETVAGTFGSNQYFSATQGTFGNNELTPTSPDVVTLLAADGGWNLYTQAEGYIGCSESGKLAANTKDVWTISVAEGGAATIDNGTYKIKYNVNSPRFSCYTGDPTESMLLPEIYKAKNAEADKFTVTYNGNGAEGSTTDSTEYTIGSEATVLNSSFTKPVGKVFKEWNTKADGTGTSYQPEAKITMLKNIELFAIWEDEYIPTGDLYTKVTSVADLAAGDKVVIADSTANYAIGSLDCNTGKTQYFFNVTSCNFVEGELNVPAESDISVLTLGKNGDYYTLSCEKGLIGAKEVKAFSFAKDAVTDWTISINDSGKAVITNKTETLGSIQRNGTTKFVNYASAQGAVELYKKSGVAKQVVLSTDELDLNVGFKGIIKVSECIGFEPTSYLWEVTSGDDVISIYSGQGTSEILVEALKEGVGEVQVTANGVKATCAVAVHDYKYDILDKENYFILKNGMLGTDLQNISDPDFGQTDQMWHFEENYLGDNSYWLLAGSKYLTFGRDVDSSTTASAIVLTDYPVNSWQITKNDTQYKVATVNANGKTVSLSQSGKLEWFAFEGNNYVDLLEAGTFDHYAVEALPTTKQYFVGDTLKPLNSHVYAYYTNGFKAEITNKIEWETLTEGTKAYGTCTILGAEVDIEMDGLKIYKGDASTFVINGLHDTYSIGEKINKDNLTVGITYKLSGSEDIVKDFLAKDDYTITPEKIEEGTEKIRIALAKDTTVYYEQNIEVKESNYVAAAHIYAGDTIILGTLGYNPYEITGGQELSYNGSKFSYEPFDYMPRGEMPLEVGKEGSYFTLKDPVTGYYLKGDNSAITFNEPDYKSAYDKGDGHYELNLSVSIGGTSIIAEMKTTLEPDFSNPMVFSSMTYVGGYEDYVVGTSHLDENKFTFDMWSKKNNYEEVYATAEVEIADWKFTGGAFYYALEISSTLPEECLFTMNYDEDFEEWVVSSKPHQDKQLYFNKDGKFGFYTRGSSYTPVMVFRDNDKPLQSEPTSVSVSFAPIEGTEPQEYMNTVSVGEQFPWTSALVVKVNYGGGASKVIPVGGYTMKQMPDTSKVGTATGIISYGQNGHQIDKPFTITVKGKTQAFDVVCKDPILVGETYQAHLDDHYEPPEGEPIKWSVSDPTLASIDQNGNVTGLKAGYVDVIATSYDGTYSDFEHVRIFQNVVSLSLDKTSMKIEAGTKETITATVLPTDASNPNVIWSSSDANIASVNNKGEVTGLSVGTATITCTTQGKPFGAEEPLTATCEVTVTPGSVVRVSGVSLDCEYKELKPGDTYQLNATVNPSNATNKNVTWESNAPQLADVNNNGKVTVKASASTGKTVYITCKTEDGGFTARCEIKIKASVTPVPVTSISLDITSKKIDVDEAFEIVATVLPNNADDKGYITWETSDDSVAQIISVGPSAATIKGIGEGTATITATCGGKTATCKVTVGDQPTPPPTPVVHVESVSLNKNNIELAPNATYSLIATINPEDADNKNVSWSSSDTTIAAVNANGKVTAIAVGEATITVKTEDGNKTATCKVVVTETPAPIVDVESVSIQVNGKDVDTQSILPQETLDLTAVINPANADNKNVVWSSSNKEIATVDARGQVTGVAPGTATITVKTVDGNKTDTITIRVVDKQAQQQSIIILSSVCGGAAVVGVGCGVGIPLGLRAKKRKLLK